jgi:hypothetical protein
MGKIHQVLKIKDEYYNLENVISYSSLNYYSEQFLHHEQVSSYYKQVNHDLLIFSLAYL